MNNISTSYLLWMLGFLGFAGVHRLYNRKIVSGLVWLCTFGLFGIGQFIDLFTIPGMVDEYNARLMFKRMFRHSPRNRHVYVGTAEPFQSAHFHQSTPDKASSEDMEQVFAGDRLNRLMLELLQAAEKRGGTLSVTQGVMDTGYSFSDVESTLRDMAKTGYIATHNDPVSGTVMFDFIELSVPDNSRTYKSTQAFQSS